jgi:hypothetical protein
MRRGEFITLLGSAAALAALTLTAQPMTQVFNLGNYAAVKVVYYQTNAWRHPCWTDLGLITTLL